ncbi:MAG: TA system VapC family ribonuclease toxin [Tepidisphaeraceae bacterium]|jgi:toxin-antitoxin system PIN domain toxin
MANEPALLDTNVLVYSLYQDAPQHAACRAIVERGRGADAALFVAAQTMAELYSVITNPRRVTNPRSTAEAIDAIERFLAMPGLALVHQPVDVVARWCDLLRHHAVTGGDIFDLQLVATMMASGIARIYTFNQDDFKPFSGIQILTP